MCCFMRVTVSMYSRFPIRVLIFNFGFAKAGCSSVAFIVL